jgi:hypothetical protein
MTTGSAAALTQHAQTTTSVNANSFNLLLSTRFSSFKLYYTANANPDS